MNKDKKEEVAEFEELDEVEELSELEEFEKFEASIGKVRDEEKDERIGKVLLPMILIVPTILCIIVICVISLVQGVTPEQELKYYLSSKYKGIEFVYKSNYERSGSNYKEGLAGVVENIKEYLVGDTGIRWSFEVYPKDNENLKFEVISIMGKGRGRGRTISRNPRKSSYISTTDEFDSVVLESIQKEIKPLDISDPANDSEYAQMIYDSLKKVEEMVDQYKIKFYHTPYLTAEVFIADSKGTVYLEVGSKYTITLESIIAKIEWEREHMER